MAVVSSPKLYGCHQPPALQQVKERSAKQRFVTMKVCLNVVIAGLVLLLYCCKCGKVLLFLYFLYFGGFHYNVLYTGTVLISPPEIASICIGDQLEQMCTTTGSLLEWNLFHIDKAGTSQQFIQRGISQLQLHHVHCFKNFCSRESRTFIENIY